MSHDDLLQEASDPATAPERLGQLAFHQDDAVQRAAWKNPSLPEDVWRKTLLWGEPEAWANPMAPFYVLTWTPRKNDPRSLEDAARWATKALWKEPTRCSSEGKTLLANKIQEEWFNSISGRRLISFLGEWANVNGTDSPQHREVVRITVLCVRTAPDITAKGPSGP